jgi:Transposase domain (DUF772)
MLCWITILGGVLIMMGQHSRSEALFYYFRLEDQVPENHLLRLIEKHISFAFVREKLKESYSDTGRPSIDPELLLRILLIGHLYGITSERKLVEELGGISEIIGPRLGGSKNEASGRGRDNCDRDLRGSSFLQEKRVGNAFSRAVFAPSRPASTC